MEDVREGVIQISKLSRAAREVVRETSRDSRANSRDNISDATFEAALKQKLGYGPNFEVWIPPF